MPRPRPLAIALLVGLSLSSALRAEPPAGRGPDFVPGRDNALQRALDSRRSLDTRIREAGRREDPAKLSEKAAERAAERRETRGSETAREARLNADARVRAEARGRELRGKANAETKATPKSENSRRITGRGKETAPGQLMKQGIARADALLALRLASIDHLRDVALANGNTALLEKADELEVIARSQYDRRTNPTPPPAEEAPPADEPAPAPDAEISTDAELEAEIAQETASAEGT
jgi:hypothetical protein